MAPVLQYIGGLEFGAFGECDGLNGLLFVNAFSLFENGNGYKFYQFLSLLFVGNVVLVVLDGYVL